MLSVTADHALRAVLFLARQPAGRVASADVIAGAIGAPRNYLSKTLYELAKAGILTSTAGRAGGFALATDSRTLTIAAVVDRFDAAPQSDRCLLGDRPCNAGDPCAAHERWMAVKRAYRDALEQTTVADLAFASRIQVEPSSKALAAATRGAADLTAQLLNTVSRGRRSS